MKAIQFEQYGEPVKVLTVQERLSQNPEREKCGFVSWPALSIHQTCCLCEDTMQVSNLLSHHPSDSKGSGS
jgi:hypothetical protein